MVKDHHAAAGSSTEAWPGSEWGGKGETEGQE